MSVYDTRPLTVVETVNRNGDRFHSFPSVETTVQSVPNERSEETDDTVRWCYRTVPVELRTVTLKVTK